MSTGETTIKLVAGIVSTSILAWLSWLTVMVIDRPTRGIVSEMIQIQAPYVKDREDIRSKLNALKAYEARIDSHLDRLNTALQELKIEIVRLRTQLDRN